MASFNTSNMLITDTSILKPVVDFIVSNKLKIKLKVEGRENPEWSNLFLIPTLGYLESNSGPVPLRLVGRIDIQTYYQSQSGVKMPIKKVSVFKELHACLTSSDITDFEVLENQDVIRLNLA